MFCDKAISATIAAHFAGLPHDVLPEATRHATRRALLDAVGVTLGATGLGEDAAPYRRHAETTPGPSRLIGFGGSSTPALAALANGALAHQLDFGDTFDAGPAHPNAALVPALLALADARPALAFGEFLAAMAAGSDLACRLSIAAPRPYEEGGWYPPPLVNLIATAAACARFIGLDADGIRHAMGLALLQGSFPSEIKYDATSPIRGVREGLVARAAVEAALLAEAGATAFAEPLEGRAGFFAVYGGGAPRDALLDGLGEAFLGDQVSFKPWPACRGTHPYIEAALVLRDRIDPARVVRIEAETGPIQEMLIRPQPVKAEPGRAIDAKFSIPYTVAAALIDGAVTLDSFAAERIADPATRALAHKVVERRNPDWGRGQAASGSLAVTLDDGCVLIHRVMQAAGHPDRPMDNESLIAKFVDCAAHAAQPIDARRAQTMALNILDFSPDRPACSLIDQPACAPET
ncbi:MULTISPECIES: MmgE/PrpD family protein [unclassified Sphingomonas]|uniref:MmgE/PrpD family protein n=1 Tax=unclassified Sphingomonas TaxID=196159 RepID=UPI002150FC24|nr:MULTISPECIES: MmgE/PrpD family protein [unclassified Sphingomonas]MCR5872492.1 MmgE/PrpD family protein [Sphingomonas sp. J344]UUX99224.1 MmgE/PrpD family protein [Sphingomonas sp. J315]